MLVWCDEPHDPIENMRRDSALLAAVDAGALREPVLRLFGFRPAGITLGRTQDPALELDLARCAADGVPWALRPTGGGAIFHDDEWTFALIAPLADPEWGGPPRRAYQRTCELLAAALRSLGVPVTLGPGAGGAPAHARGARAAGMPCFASHARHELLLDGRKLAGVAQRRTHRALLQQGSILLGPGHARLVDYQRLAAGDREHARAALLGAAAFAGPVAGFDRALASLHAAVLALLPGATSHSGPMPPAAVPFRLTLETREA